MGKILQHQSAMAFLTALQELYNNPAVEKVLQTHELPTTAEICFATYATQKAIIASYNRLHKQIALNVDDSTMQQFVAAQNPKQAALYFLPIVAHELAHDKSSAHTRAFYDHKSDIEQQLKIAIASYLLGK